MSVKGFWSNAKNRLMKRSIQNVISLSFTLVVLAGMTFLGLALLLRFTSSTRTIIGDQSRRTMNLVAMNLDNYLRSMMRVSDAMYYRIIKNTDFTKTNANQELSLLYEANKDYVVSIALLDNKGQLLSSVPLAKLSDNGNPTQKDWYINALRNIENVHFTAPYVQNLFDDRDYRYPWVVSLSRSVELNQGGVTSRGVLLVDMRFFGIEQIFQNVNFGETGYMFLTDAAGELIYHPRQQLIYSGLAAENHLEAAFLEDGVHHIDTGGTDNIVSVRTVGYTGWKIIGISPATGFAPDFYNMQSFVMAVILFTLFLMIFANIFASSRIADPIIALERSVKRLEEGDFSAPIAVGGSYEIAHLGNTVQSMVTQMRRLMDDMVREQESKRKTELDALQAQINPHFLYNTLDSIVWMIESQRYPEAISMVTSLARLFRISLSKGKTIITLEDEISHGQHYMTIQKMRYKNKFQVTFSPSPETLGLSSMKLIIQPVLENAIYHGMEYMDGDGEIEVRTFLREQVLYITVRDNGNGMSEQVCQTLLTGENHVRSKGSGIGLRNVHQRIQLAFGSEYGLEIESELDEGTTVTIRQPAIPYEGNGGGKELGKG